MFDNDRQTKVHSKRCIATEKSKIEEKNIKVIQTKTKHLRVIQAKILRTQNVNDGQKDKTS